MTMMKMRTTQASKACLHTSCRERAVPVRAALSTYVILSPSTPLGVHSSKNPSEFWTIHSSSTLSPSLWFSSLLRDFVYSAVDSLVTPPPDQTRILPSHNLPEFLRVSLVFQSGRPAFNLDEIVETDHIE